MISRWITVYEMVEEELVLYCRHGDERLIRSVALLSFNRLLFSIHAKTQAGLTFDAIIIIT